MTFGSLFTGYGGLDLGLERAGLECRWQCETNPDARLVLDRHWPRVPLWDDVADFNPRPGAGYDVDLICGGDPCQGNSKALQSLRAGEGPAVHFLRVVDRLRPRFVLRENPSSARLDAPWPWQRFRGELERLGYAVLPFRLRACCVGAHHQRDRLFLLAELPDAHRLRPQGVHGQGMPPQLPGGTPGDDLWHPRPNRLPASRICRARDGLPRRVERTVGLGNAVHVAVGERIGRTILANA